MTFIQLQVIIMAAELGSVSLAAKQLNISQSNASSYIKNVEDELNFKILDRSRSGVKITDKGKDFLEHAKKIIHESESINFLSKEKEISRLRIGSTNFEAAFDALLDTYNEYINEDRLLDIQFNYVSLENGFVMLKEYKIDVLVAYLRESSLQTAKWLSTTNDLKQISLKELDRTFGLRIRKGHPLFSNPEFAKGNFNISMLKDYPYVDYSAFAEESKIPNVDDNSYRLFSNHLIIDGKENRNKVIASTNAYGIGIGVSKEDESKYNIVFYPIQGLIGYCFVFVRKNEDTTNTIERYLYHIKKKA